jgi:hypothetical protein
MGSIVKYDYEHVSSHQIMAGPVEKRPLIRPRCRWENNKMGTKEIG